MVEAAEAVTETHGTKPLRVGLDIGSTTVKAVVLDQSDALADALFSDYRRHHANVRATVAGLLADIHKELEKLGRGDEPIRLAITGSGGLALADSLDVPFIQEVIAETEAIDKEYPQADVIIELGGEDAKITYLKPTPEQRMNGSCAGGTGAFIDQMATLLDTDAAGLNEMATQYETLYPIASRCGVFAKTDLQPLINDGAAKPGSIDLHGSGHANHRRPCLRTPDPRNRDLPGRSVVLHVRAASRVQAGARRQSGRIHCSDRCSPVCGIRCRIAGRSGW